MTILTSSALAAWLATDDADPNPIVTGLAEKLGVTFDANAQLAVRLEALSARDQGATDGTALLAHLSWLANKTLGLA